ncbi:hypothetical protein ALC57_04844 [Trachymyrmex cornetzi]|uniref:Uncharacterized protein n=1 Tax=Trachymyrmex cornetzi TaxID=471704 RepID=A0A195ECW6_9HYME|nr:hypothetical protein ALC57_04844 [Trachymyrmex cornetzi]
MEDISLKDKARMREIFLPKEGKRCAGAMAYSAEGSESESVTASLHFVARENYAATAAETQE